MATKTISIELDVYDRLKNLKRSSRESFSEVLRRILAEPRVITGADIVKLIDEGRIPRVISDEGLDLIERAQHEHLGSLRPARKRRAG